MMVVTLYLVVLFWFVATRKRVVVWLVFLGQFFGQARSIAAFLAPRITLCFLVFVQLADELPPLSHLGPTDLCDDLTETFAASWATLDKTNSQMSFPRLSISTSPSKVLQTALVSLPLS